MIRTSYWTHIETNILGDEETPTHDMQKKFWRHVKAVKKDRVGVAPLKDNNELTSDAKTKATLINKQYQSVFSKEDPTNIPDPIEPPSPEMPEISVSRDGVLKLLLNLKENKASGPDLIPPRILKIAAQPLSLCLTILFNASLSTSIVPQDWKRANITPVFKKGERSKASNYRPVSLTCICSKMLEHIVVSQMMDHFDSHNILVDCQHGFRSNRSCETQLLSLSQDLHQHLENRKQVDMIVLDFSKAFDKVPHHRLLRKLRNYGIHGSTLCWIASFLLGRKQRVVIDGETSDWADVESGVPQGTVLGPILFLAYINDLPRCVRANVRLFADDCVLYRVVDSAADCLALQEDLVFLEQWEDSWCMSFNPGKCSTITITRKHHPLSHPYTLHSEVLQTVDSATYLGIELSSNLTWAMHINKMCSKANKQLAFLRRNLKINSPDIKATAYKGLIRPLLEYCACVWDPHHQKYIDQLEMVQRRAARYVLNQYSRTESVTAMIDKLGWELLEQRRMNIRLTMFYKIENSLVAVPLPPSISRPIRTNPGYPHRYIIPKSRTDSYKFSFFPHTISQWNCIPPAIACKESLPSFKAAFASA